MADQPASLASVYEVAQTIERARETRQGLTYCHMVIRPRMASVRTYRRPD